MERLGYIIAALSDREIRCEQVLCSAEKKCELAVLFGVVQEEKRSGPQTQSEKHRERARASRFLFLEQPKTHHLLRVSAW